MGSLSRLRKACGALKDSTSLTLAKLKSDFKDLDIAIVNATNHLEAPPKERHVQTIFAATEVTRPRADVAYCIYALSRRLTKTSNWIVAIKVLIVIHRALREGDPTFREELMNYSHKGYILHMGNFKDDSSSLASYCSGWVRAYALYIEERLECLRVLEYDIEAEPSTTDSADAIQVHSRTTLPSIEQLLEQLPALQQLLYRVVECKPEGGACTNYLIHYSLSLVLKESFKIYGPINDGIINLLDTYFEMPKHDAVKALSFCRRAGKQAEILANFYDFCKHLKLGTNLQFPTLIQPIPSFLDTMEDYVKEAPERSLISHRQLYLPERDGSGYVEQNSVETKEQLVLREEVSKEKQEDSKLLRKSEFRDLISIDDLLGLNDINPKAEEPEKLIVREQVSEEKQEDSELLRKSGFRDLISTDDLLGLTDMDPKAEEPDQLILREEVSEEKEEDSKLFRKSEFRDLISLDDLLGLADMDPKAEEPDQLALREEVSEEKQEDSKLLRKSEFREMISLDDLLVLGLNDTDPKAEETEESTTSTGNDPQSLYGEFRGPDTTAWELALFSAPSNDSNNANSAPFQQKQNVQQHCASNQCAEASLTVATIPAPVSNINWTYYHKSWQYLQPQTLGKNPSNPFEDPL